MTSNNNNNDGADMHRDDQDNIPRFARLSARLAENRERDNRAVRLFILGSYCYCY